MTANDAYQLYETRKITHARDSLLSDIPSPPMAHARTYEGEWMGGHITHTHMKVAAGDPTCGSTSRYITLRKASFEKRISKTSKKGVKVFVEVGTSFLFILGIAHLTGCLV